MDAVKFIEERERLCGTYKICKDCPANGNPGCLFNLSYGADADEQVSFLEEWSKANPIKTRQSTFMEQYPEASVDNCGCLMICPKLISIDYRNRYGDCVKHPCSDCRREFWTQEVE